MKWETPPEPANRLQPHQPKYLTEAAELKDNPGQWGYMGARPTISSAAAFAMAIRAGKLAAFARPSLFEAVARGKKVWARYLGTTSEPDLVCRFCGDPVNIDFTGDPHHADNSKLYGHGAVIKLATEGVRP